MTLLDGAQPAPTTTVQVPFADCWITAQAQEAALAVMQSGWVTTGQEGLAFESAFSAHVGADHAIAVSSCTAAIELALRSLRLPQLSPVLVSTMTFCGAVQAIFHAGLRPVLVDVDPVTAMPTPATTRAAVRACGGASAMLVVHWAGDPADVAELAEAAGLSLDVVVEDAAHALGTSLGDRPVGSLSGATCFSFYATKNLPIGEGGMVTTNDPDRAAWIRGARLHGMSADAWRRYQPGGSWRYDVPEPGLKANLTDLQSAIGRAQLTQLDTWQHRRARIAARYDDLLAELPVDLPHRPRPGAGTHAWHLYPIRLRAGCPISRDDLIAALAERGIGTSVHFIPVHQLTYFNRAAQRAAARLPGADALFETLLSLPMYPRLTDEQVDAVGDALSRLTRTEHSTKDTRTNPREALPWCS